VNTNQQSANEMGNKKVEKVLQYFTRECGGAGKYNFIRRVVLFSNTQACTNVECLWCAIL
jgi:hypothetical protein